MTGNWDVTITDTDGTDHSPALVTPPQESFPKRIPAANGRPRFQFAVPPERDSNGDPKWFQDTFEEADVAVSLNGTDQPYSTIVGVEDRVSDGVTILEAVGGDELDTPVDTSFGIIETHTAAESVITDNTSYGTDVPTPSTAVDQDVLVEEAIEDLTVDDLARPPRAAEPIKVTSDNHVTLHQTLFFAETSTSLSAAGDSLSLDFTTGYDWPDSRVAGAVLLPPVTDPVGLAVKIDGVVVGVRRPGEAVDSKGWIQYEGTNSRLSAGEHTLTVEVIATEDAAGASLSAITPEAIVAYDAEYEYDFDTALVDGPQLYPQVVYVPFAPASGVTRAVTGLNVRSYWVDNVAAVNRLDNGTQIYSAPGGEADSTFDFTDRGPIAKFRVALGRYGSDATKTPESGFKAHELTGYQLSADLEDMPLVVNEEFSGTVASVLDELRDTLRGNFVWAYDTDSNGDSIVRFVRSGSQTTTENDLEDYTVSKSVAEQLDEVTVRGGRVTVTNEGVTLERGTAVRLNSDRLVEGSETVASTDRDEVYRRGEFEDYTIDYESGTITAQSGTTASIDDGERVRVSYRFQPQATVSVDTPTDPIRAETVTLLALESDEACRLAGKQLIDATSTPSYDATARVRGNTTFSVVTALTASRLPTGADLSTTDIEATPAGASVRLEARQPLGEVVGDLRDRLETLAQNVN